MVKHIQTIRRQQPTNCLNVSDHFVGLVLKGFILGAFSLYKCHSTHPIFAVNTFSIKHFENSMLSKTSLSTAIINYFHK